MTKVVYNRCYGGFGLSDEATERYLQIKNIPYYREKGRFSSFGDTFFLSPPTGDKKKDENRDTFYYGDIEDRSDPVLIQVVEELGEKANGMCAKLVIEDIPAGSRYRIDEYDGLEHIEYADDVDWNIA